VSISLAVTIVALLNRKWVYFTLSARAYTEYLATNYNMSNDLV
jgi:hypothetical protein